MTVMFSVVASGKFGVMSCSGATVSRHHSSHALDWPDLSCGFPVSDSAMRQLPERPNS